MDVALKYKVNLPEKISDILNSDFWILNQIPAAIAAYSTEPMRFATNAFIFLKRGECVVDINLRRYELKGPTYICIRANSYFHIRSVSEDLDAGVVVVSQDFTDRISIYFRERRSATALTNIVIPLDVRMGAEFTRLYNTLQTLYNNKENPDRLQAILHYIISFFFANSQRLRRTPRMESLPSASRRMADDFLSLVQTHFIAEHNLSYYAEKLSVTPKHLSRTVKEVTGFSASQWIDRYLLLEAKVMLKSSTLTVSQIGDALHFATASAFGKFFRKATGMTPKQFRKSPDDNLHD